MKRYAILPIFSLAMVGCGGGSDSSSGETGTAQTPPVSQGSIERVTGDTISVNGHNYSLDNLTVTYQDETLPTSILSKNMMVRISEDNTRRPGGAVVTLEPTFTGKVDSISPDRKSFVINGVELPFTLSSNINVGSNVMVSALPTETGYNVLSVIEFNHWNGQAETEGLISQLGNNTFKIGASLTVDFSNINVTFPLSNGMWVEVIGMYDTDTGILRAEKITRDDYTDIPNDGEIEGIVTFVKRGPDGKPRSFTLNYSAQIQTVGSTEYDDGFYGDHRDLVAGAWVEVELKNNKNKLMAKEIEFEDDNDDNDDNDWEQNEFDIEGYALVSDSELKTFTITDVCSNKEFTVSVDNLTNYEGLANFDELHRQYVEVEGHLFEGQHIARSIDVEDDSNDNDCDD
ncbi:DUF5666 domain-containing protein [Vibrio renipiscarius]|uniref:DUF5666 domain-containing protein n=1 Tax=Vibrio renipiscarius TaxID=1461322 RepID=A0A0C2KCG2_9VIBR|nr:DUF5666 domain-containing protein [Vibrio renipiscarius]KII79763.1 hypothetical protein PL18_08950 [Vibrio renipiscarius]KII80610.1 hypothetical protein OJ16_04715 [Vibrio renipiscarius]